MFGIEEKVALVTGAASGIGYAFVKALLKNNVKAVALIDNNAEKGQEALNEFRLKFGEERAIFIKADVSNKNEFQEAFEITTLKFKQLDIVINNAGIFNEKQWEKCISINLNGVVIGSALAMERYLPKYKSGAEGVIVNVASAAGVLPFEEGPIYAATKAAVVHYTRSLGGDMHYHQSKVRMLAICPGFTNTSLAIVTDQQIDEPYLSSFQKQIETSVHQDPDILADNVMNMIRKSPNGSIWLGIQGSCVNLEFPNFCDSF